MYEVEVKVEVAHGPVRERLAAIDAEPLGTVRQRDTYYDHPARSFAESDEALRLRRETKPNAEPTDDEMDADPVDATDAELVDDGTVATLTYKGPLVDGDSKTREEVETRVADPGAADALLRAVGFEPAADVEKERERFASGGYLVALDSVTDLGEFVEIEAEGDAESVDELREGAFDLCARLGLDPDESIRTSYLALLLDVA